MKAVRAKKKLGQHFLKDEFIAESIVNALTFHNGYTSLLEVGPGMGMLTKYLLNKSIDDFKTIEIDHESNQFLSEHLSLGEDKILQGDFLKIKPEDIFAGNFGIIGNFPYNISSQIFFKVLEYKDKVQEVVGMLQKEVAERICAPPGKRACGVLSVFLNVYYDAEYLFTVHEDVFDPPPKVKSAVIRLRRNSTIQIECNEKIFTRIVKTGFQMRRKTLRNALKSLNLPLEIMNLPILNKRAEQLSVEDFIFLTNLIDRSQG
jgi:16S rRNA (adenine1518-N6/adenine1519-N6)-dimethyltransferase